jgi:hypothetical protein
MMSQVAFFLFRLTSAAYTCLAARHCEGSALNRKRDIHFDRFDWIYGGKGSSGQICISRRTSYKLVKERREYQCAVFPSILYFSRIRAWVTLRQGLEMLGPPS